MFIRMTKNAAPVGKPVKDEPTRDLRVGRTYETDEVLTEALANRLVGAGAAVFVTDSKGKTITDEPKAAQLQKAYGETNLRDLASLKEGETASITPAGTRR